MKMSDFQDHVTPDERATLTQRVAELNHPVAEWMGISSACQKDWLGLNPPAAVFLEGLQ